MTSFKSYVDLDLDDSCTETVIHDEPTIQLRPNLLQGETVVVEARKVLKFAPFSDRKHGISGSLFVTTFRLSFVSSEHDISSQRSSILGDNDICLLNVDHIYQLTDNKKKKLQPGTTVFKKVKELHICCKNFRTYTFGFKFSEVDQGRNLTNALLHYAFPEKPERLFLFDFNGPVQTAYAEPCYFSKAVHWQDELKRTGCTGWRLSRVNEEFRIFPYLPKAFIVPQTMVDTQLEEVAKFFQGSRPAVWCWGNKKGCAIVRMAQLHPDVVDRRQETVMLEKIRKAHPTLKVLAIMDLQNNLPSLKDINNSFNKLKDCCMPETARQFWQQDAHFFTQIESTRWLQTISVFLDAASSAVKYIEDEKTVVLVEGQGRDACAVVSSLAQLLLDNHFRTISGFQTLIQKEWVSLGHPFIERLGRLRDRDEQSPLFFVFLDCVWQLLQQFPTEFEFTETYLTTLWDTTHISIFDTFLFNCERERRFARMDTTRQPLPERSAWEWTVQFSQQEIALFYNPFFVISKQLKSLRNLHSNANGVKNPSTRQTLPPGFAETTLSEVPLRHGFRYTASSSYELEILACLSEWPTDIVLTVHPEVPNLQLWQQCYFRWLPELEVVGGGMPQVYFQQQLLVEEIQHLQRKLSALERGRLSLMSATDIGLMSPDLSQLKLYQYDTVNSFYPFNSGGVGNDYQRKDAVANAIELLLQNSFLADLSDSQAALYVDDD